MKEVSFCSARIHYVCALTDTNKYCTMI